MSCAAAAEEDVSPTSDCGFASASQSRRAKGGQPSFHDIRGLFTEEDSAPVESPFEAFAGQPGSPRPARRPGLPRNLNRSSGSGNKILGSLARQRSRLGSTDEPGEGPSIVELPISKGLSARLSRDCRNAVDFLERLQQPVFSRLHATTEPAMPKTALRFAKVRVVPCHFPPPSPAGLESRLPIAS
jgi:hypothetical protein